MNVKFSTSRVSMRSVISLLHWFKFSMVSVYDLVIVVNSAISFSCLSILVWLRVFIDAISEYFKIMSVRLDLMFLCTVFWMFWFEILFFTIYISGFSMFLVDSLQTSVGLSLPHLAVYLKSL